MGTIARFDLVDLHRRFGVRHFVETGTGTGDSVAYAVMQCNHLAQSLFRTFRSCEINVELTSAANVRFKDDPRVHVFNEKSEVFLDWICGALPYDEPVLFWLDAHFPGADYGRGGYGDERDAAIRLPLHQEIEIISLLRPAAKDVIVCDDLRIYVDGPFQHNNVPENVRPFCPQDRNIDFVHQLMDATHDVKELYEHEGYILITPKGNTDDT